MRGGALLVAMSSNFEPRRRSMYTDFMPKMHSIFHNLPYRVVHRSKLAVENRALLIQQVHEHMPWSHRIASHCFIVEMSPKYVAPYPTPS